MAFEELDKLTDLLKRQDNVLDSMLDCQIRLHKWVKERNWTELETSLQEMKLISDEFVSLDQEREALVGSHKEVYLLEQIEPLFFQLRTKLSKSKIENQALNEYVSLTQNFIDGVLEECVPQKRTTLYSPKGIVKPPVQSVVINTLM